MKTFKYLTLGLLIAGLSVSVQAQDALTESLQRGLFEEEANRDLEAAAEAYQEVVENWDGQRALASTAIFRLGEVYRKLGRLDEAVEQYRRILNEFSDQETLVTLSRQNLTGMGFADASGDGVSATNVASTPLSQGAKEEMVELLEEEISLLEEELKATESLIQNGLRPPSEPAPLRREILSLRRELVRLNDAPVLGETTASAVSLITSEEEQEIQRIRALIANSPDLINAVTGTGNDHGTPLQRAAKAGYLKVAEFLIENGANVNWRNNGPLLNATESGHKAMVELLLEHGANVNIRDENGGTLLHYAVGRGFLGITDVLLQEGVNVNVKSDHGWTPLMSAASSQNPEMIQLLLENGADVNLGTSGGLRPLHQTVESGNAIIAELLLEYGADVDVHGSGIKTPLYGVVYEENIGMVQLLLDKGAKPNVVDDSKQTPLHAAAFKGNIEIAQMLIDAGADVNALSRTGISPLYISVEESHIGLANLLLEKGAKPEVFNDEGVSALFCAIENDSLEIAELLLKAGADVNQLSERYGTPLHFATVQQNVQIVKLLLSFNPDLEIRHRGLTPLHTISSVEGNIDAAETSKFVSLAGSLLDAGADIESVFTESGNSWSGSTPLLTAVFRRHDRLAQLLLERGANPNAMNDQGETPLSILQTELSIDRRSSPGTITIGSSQAPRTREETEALIKLLLEHGANPYLDRMNYISLRRDSSSEPVRIFQRDEREVNQFTIFELVMAEIMRSRLAFPDYENVSIGRITSDTGEEQILNVDLREIMESGNTKGDIYLKWGDIVTIPETNHPVNAEWRIPSSETLRFLNDILERNVIVMIQNQRHEMKLDPEFYSYPGMSLSQRKQEIRSTLGPGEPQTLLRSAELKLVLDRSNLLLTSSDLTRVKVTRTNPEGGEPFTMEYNLEETEYPDDLWLRDGDVIEVPEKE